MSAPVDVLAVMDRAVIAAVAELYAERDRLANIVRDHEKQITRMTAERAELVEAVKAVQYITAHRGRLEKSRVEWMDDKLRAALAKFGGAA